MFNFEDRIDLIFNTGFFNFQFNFSRALALRTSAFESAEKQLAASSIAGRCFMQRFRLELSLDDCRSSTTTQQAFTIIMTEMFTCR